MDTTEGEEDLSSEELFRKTFREVMRRGIAKFQEMQPFYDANPHLEWQVCDLWTLKRHLLREIREWQELGEDKELLDIINIAVMLYGRRIMRVGEGNE